MKEDREDTMERDTCDCSPEGEQTCCVYCNNNVVFALTPCSADFTQV